MAGYILLYLYEKHDTTSAEPAEQATRIELPQKQRKRQCKDHPLRPASAGLSIGMILNPGH